MENSSQVTVYVRKVDKKAVKLMLEDRAVTSSQMYEALIAQKEFLNFIQSDLGIKIDVVKQNPNQKLQKMNKIRQSIDLYYGGNLIASNDDHSLIKLKNMSIIHIVIKKIPPKRQPNAKNNSQPNPEVKLDAKISAAKNQHSENNLNRLQLIQQTPEPENYQITLSFVINQNTNILTQKQNNNITLPNTILPLNNQKKITLNLKNLDQINIKKTLIGINVLQILEKLIVRQNFNTSQTSENIVKIHKSLLKLVHMGRIASVSISRTEKQSIQPNYRSRQFFWSYLNLVDKAEIVVFISSVFVETKIIQKADETPKQNSETKKKSLFLELEHVLTIRLYEEYKIWGKQWKCQKQILDQKGQIPSTEEWIKNNENQTVDECDFKDLKAIEVQK